MMKPMRVIQAVACSIPMFALALAACTADTGDPAANENTGVDEVGNSTVHLMRPHTRGSANAFMGDSAPAGAHLTYYGGPVISNVKVYAVFWNSAVKYQSTISSFYSTITASAYFDWLTEYNTGTQSIGHGTLAGSLIDTGAPAGTKITDTQIHTEINRLISTGAVPAPDANTLYMVHFPPGITIDQGGGNLSCQVFCAYHGTYTRNNQYVYYGVIPDLGGSCASGCGGGTQDQNTTSVSSHELIEAVTDPAVGLATANASPLAWYDTTNGEIGDICNAQQATVAGFTVQKEFSNQAKDCIATKSSGSTSASSTSATTGSGSTTAATSTSATTGSGGGSCAHGICSTGTKLVSSCDPCAQKICAADSYCCNNQWDSQCVGEVKTICGQTCGGGSTGSGGTTSSSSATTGSGGGGTCVHAICNTGVKLTSSCDPCAKKICTADSYCCNNQWDSQCVSEVGSICGQACQ
jgi:hypothetical protein